MARGAAQARRKRTKAEAARRRRRAQSATPTRVAEQTMFFPKLRRQAKWVFVILALVFALGFVVFGVGSGGGIGLGDLFNSGGGSKKTASESDARDRIKKNPKDAQAYRALATALQTKGDLRGAANALKTFTTLKPRNADALTELGGLYTALGARLQTEITAAQEASQENSFAQVVNTGIQLKGQQVVGPNVIFQTLTDRTNQRLSELYQRQQDDYNQAEGVGKRIVALKPKDADARLNLGVAAQTAGDTKTAIAAYKRFIKLAPDDSRVRQVNQQIKALRQASKASPTVQGG
jgi:tetratricopeptide (TPR) repeat protein